MAKTQPTASKTTVSEVPVGGNPTLVPSKMLEARTVKWNDRGGGEEGTPSGTVADLRAASTDEAKADAVRAVLLEGKAPPVEPAKPAGEGDLPVKPTDKVDGEPPPAEKPKRRDILASLEAEKKARGLEAQLGEERKLRQAAEKSLKEGDLNELIKARGLTEEQALEIIVTRGATPGKEPPKAASDPEVVALKAEVDALKAQNTEASRQAAIGIVKNFVKDLDTPLVRAASKIPITDDAGNVVRVVDGPMAVLIEAQRQWIAAGAPAGQNFHYLKPAAEAVEAQLAEDNAELVDAGAAKRGWTKGEAKVEAIKKTGVPAVGTKRTASGGGTPNVGENLPDDRDERRRAIAERMGWTE